VTAPALPADHELEVMIDGGSRPVLHDRGQRERPRLAEISAAGLVRRASEQDGTAVERSLPVGPALRPLFPGGCLRRGATIVVAGGSGSTSLVFALLAEASAAGSWCAALGLPALGLAAAAEAGVALERFALVPNPGPDWTAVAAALFDGLDIVVAAVPARVPARMAERLAARARQRGAVFIAANGAPLPGADLTLEVVDGAWHGLGQGRGRLRGHEVRVAAYGRGAAARTRYADLWLPGGVTPPDHAPRLAASPEPALRLAG